MRIVPAMVDMRRTPEEKAEVAEERSGPPPVSDVEDYPYGLRIALTNDELEKLDLQDENVEVGDMLHIHAFAKVTSVSETDNADTGPQCRIELTLTHIAAEDEETENEEDEARESRPGKMYG